MKRRLVDVILMPWLQWSVWQHHWPLPSTFTELHVLDIPRLTINATDIFYFKLEYDSTIKKNKDELTVQ